mmetsp:Transcript_43568/g.105646  ORF Transcript_43568/g.105646 Transcript_43568/m.105646 type:complete len:287 (-) Transcript_43568:1647-2507(-)
MMDGEAWKLRQKESVYRKLYSDLLQKHRGALQEVQSSSSSLSSSSSDPKVDKDPPASSSSSSYNVTSSPQASVIPQQKDPYEDETNALNQIFRTEVGNLVVGVASTAVTFLALRFGKTRILSSPIFGGLKTPETFQQAESHARQYGTEHTQNRISVFVEGMFSLWVGFRCYDYSSHQSQSTWQAVADIPLCQGRSRVSDALCPDWVETTHKEVPTEFWDAVSDGTVRDPQTWNAIRSFSMNCERRWQIERQIRREQGLRDTNRPVVLPQRVEGSFPIDSSVESEIA